MSVSRLQVPPASGDQGSVAAFGLLAFTSVSAALACYSADHDPETVYRSRPGDCRQGRANQHSHHPAWHLAKLGICSPKSEHSMQIWKLFQGQILAVHNHSIQVRGVVRINWISDVTAFLLHPALEDISQVVFLLRIWICLWSDIPKWGNHLLSYSWLMLDFLSRENQWPHIYPTFSFPCSHRRVVSNLAIANPNLKSMTRSYPHETVVGPAVPCCIIWPIKYSFIHEV